MSSLNIIFCLLLSTTLPLFVYSSGGFSIDLIHRDSPNAPFYNPSLSHFDRLRAAVHRSIARANHFRASSFTFSVTSPAPAPSPLPFDSVVIPGDYEYLMTINVGTPPLKIHAIADTGSDLIWAQCKPCIECYPQNDPIYDPSTSSTYGTVSCSADTCSDLEGSCTNTSGCQYQYGYGDGSQTVGILSSETFTFDSEGRRPVSIPKIQFGCSHESTGTFDKIEGGLVGLGGGPLSLVSQLGSSIEHKFSYCLVPYSEANTSDSLLNFGANAEVTGPNAVTTPIITARDIETFYFLDLEVISVGDEVVFRNNASSSSETGDGNIIIDSGTTLTILDDSMMKPLVSKILQVVKYPRVENPDLDVCFDVSNSTGTDLELPEMTFEFSGAPLKLTPLNTFVAMQEGVVCLAIVSSGQVGGLRIYGNIAQQNWHIGYDLGATKLTFAPADCAKL